ncbi:MAG: flagellar hook-length control protein FliK [Rhodoferax sp.]|uniref:flagellar hook-length control protein FliK n=1 Tax=Rhodoferax sp. TaxID=50421 RepID=UPI0026319449|nr:flagellar hook-length control protein FliK [Rhodoferax sp.]MDD5335606.1 flagellar hook-length control protein FliK [Rhodoferax sp.]
MSLILRPNTAPGQAAVLSARAGALRDEPAQPASPSFDEVLVRSLGASLETAEKISPKTAASTPVRRPSLAPKDDSAELANAIAMTRVGVDGSTSKTNTGEQRLAGRADHPTSLSDGAAPQALAGTARRPGLPVASATSASTTVQAKTLSANPDNPAATLADTAQASLSAGLAAGVDPATQTPATATGAAPAPAATIGRAEDCADGAAASANNLNATVALSADPTAALADSTLPLARPAGAGTPAPHAAAAQGTKQRPGLPVEPSRTNSAAATVAARPASAGLDGPLPVPVATPPTALQGAAAPAAETNMAPGPAPGAGQADRSTQDDERSLASLSPALAMSADVTAALAGSMLPLARRAGADTPAPDSAVADGTTQRPGLRVEPAMTSARASSAAPTVKPRPTSAGLDNGLPVPALPAGQQSPGQVTQTEPAAASDKPTLAPAVASSAAQRLVADAGLTDWSSRNQAQSTDSLHPAVARPGDSTTAAAAPLPSIDAHAGPAIAAAATTPLAARTPRQAVTVKTGALSAAPDATLPELSSTPQPALKAGKTTLAGDDASQPTLPAVSAGAGEPAAPPLATGSFASQALGPDPAAPAAEALGTSAPSLLHPQQAASVGTAGHAAANTGEMPNAPRLSPEVGSKEWNQALSQQVLQLGKAGRQVTELQLNPPGLGPMQVTLHLNQHQMQVMFVSAHASVRAAVEAAMPQLRASLADSGISLGQTSVSSESQAHSAFAQQQHGAARQQAYRDNSFPEPAAISTRTLAGARRGGTGRGVDTYA